jgi:hypothetical protein
MLFIVDEFGQFDMRDLSCYSEGVERKSILLMNLVGPILDGSLSSICKPPFRVWLYKQFMKEGMLKDSNASGYYRR